MATSIGQDQAVEKLTDGQRECLRLVLARYNSKEIARRLGVSTSAVDKRIERAVHLLGAQSRVEAARRLAAVEGGHDPAAAIAARIEHGAISPAAALTAGLEGSREDRAEPASFRVSWNPFQRLGLIAAMIFSIAVALLVVLTVAERIAALWPDQPSWL